MMFGEPTEFAIEAYHEPYAQKYAGFGRMCIHLKGITIGKIRENHCSLFHAVNRFRKLQTDIEDLWDAEFSNWSDAGIRDILEKALYLDNGQSLEEMEADWKRLSRYVFLTNTGEQFDDSNTFIICRPGAGVHVLYRKHRENSQGSASCEIDISQSRGNFRSLV